VGDDCDCGEEQQLAVAERSGARPPRNPPELVDQYQRECEQNRKNKEREEAVTPSPSPFQISQGAAQHGNNIEVGEVGADDQRGGSPCRATAEAGLGECRAEKGMTERVYSSLASSSSCTLPWSAVDTGHPFLAASAALANPAWSTLGTFPRTSRRILVILNPSPAFSIVQEALVVIRVAGVPFFSSPADRAMLRHAAWAAAISSSGLVPRALSNRVAKE
jgi:hypothetical protein